MFVGVSITKSQTKKENFCEFDLHIIYDTGRRNYNQNLLQEYAVSQKLYVCKTHINAISKIKTSLQETTWSAKT